jgi:hypothetical protein
MRQEGVSYTSMPTADIGGEDRLGRPCVGPRPMNDICRGRKWWRVARSVEAPGRRTPRRRVRWSASPPAGAVSDQRRQHLRELRQGADREAQALSHLATYLPAHTGSWRE